MRTFALASGSSGNAFLIEDDAKNKYLVDIGISYKKVCEVLEEKNISPNEICGVFLTHEHTDHVQGLDVFMKNTNCPIYLTQGTFEALNIKKSKRLIFIKENQILELEKIKVFVISKSHDAKEPVSFVFDSQIGRIGVFTDLGFVSSQILEILKNLDIIYFETNFCEEKVKNINYSSMYISRLHSNIGHLSIQDSLEVLGKFAKSGQRIILSHISENTNTYENSYRLVKDFLIKKDISCELFVSFQGVASDWIE